MSGLIDASLEAKIIAFVISGAIEFPKLVFFGDPNCRKVVELGEIPSASKEYAARANVSLDFVFSVLETDAFGDPSKDVRTLKDLYQRRLKVERLERERKDAYDFSRKIQTGIKIKQSSHIASDINALIESYGSGITFGFPAWESVIGGLKPTELMSIVAPSGTYKTAFALNLAWKASRINKGLSVGFMSFEMSGGSVGLRAMSMYFGVTGKEIVWTKHNDPEKWSSWMAEFTDKLSNVHVVDMPTTLEGIEHSIDEMPNCRLIVIDYLDFIEVPSTEQKGDWVNKLARNIKNLAKRKEVAIILLAQVEIKKLREGGRTRLTDARGGGGIKDACDVGWVMSKIDGEIIGEFDKVRSPADPEHMNDDFACGWDGVRLMDLMPRSKTNEKKE